MAFHAQFWRVIWHLCPVYTVREQKEMPLGKLTTPKLAAPIAVSMLVVVWTYAASPFSEYGDNWAVYPVLLAAVIVFLWHIGLLIYPDRSSRFNMAVYAVIHCGLSFINHVAFAHAHFEGQFVIAGPLTRRCAMRAAVLRR